MAGWTNRGKLRTLQGFLGNTQIPANFNIHLITPATAPTAGVDILNSLGQVADGNGYSTAGYSLNRDTTDFDTFTEQDTGSRSFAQIKDVVWTASGGAIPSGGSGARYAVLTDANATITSRNVYYYWDLTSERTVSDGQTLTIQDMQINANES
jgi:hypothetical protein